LGNGKRCIVKNCFNRHSNDLNLFNLPNYYTLRNKWIKKKKCGSVAVSTKKAATSQRVLLEHNCFINTKQKLKPDAIPSLFLDYGSQKLIVFLFYFILYFLLLWFRMFR